jgi:hypothetical protein
LGLISTGGWFSFVDRGERRIFMSHFHLQRPPRKVAWWQKIWNNFKTNFPGRSSEQARAFIIPLIIFAVLLLLTRLYFEYRGIRI